MNNLATLYNREGHYHKAESLYKKTLTLREKILSKEHPDTLLSMNNLASLYNFQGRYSEADSLTSEVVRISTQVLGRNHRFTLTAINNRGMLLCYQGRYSEAEPLYKEALRLRKDVLGEEHPDTLVSMNNLAMLYDLQERYEKAEPLLKRVLSLYEKVSGPNHPDTISKINNLGSLYISQGRYKEAEPFLNKALRLCREVLGPNHPDTIAQINNLASLYVWQGRYNEAEPLCKQVLQLSGEVLGRKHPRTITAQNNYIVILINTGRPALALHVLQDQERRLFSRSFQELYTSSNEKVRRLYLQSISSFQNIVFLLASQQLEKEYEQFAAEVMLRWKQVYAEENKFQHDKINFMQEMNDITKELSRYREQEEQEFEDVLELFNKKESELLTRARKFKKEEQLEVAKKRTLDVVLSTLPQDSGLIEYRLFFTVGKKEELHLATVLLLADPKAKQRFVFRDLGPFAEIEKHLHEETAEAYNRLLGPFDEQINNLKRLYIAPDGPLSLLSFASLRLPDGRFLAERQQINRLQTGRDLLENGKDFPRGKGMIALPANRPRSA